MIGGNNSADGFSMQIFSFQALVAFPCKMVYYDWIITAVYNILSSQKLFFELHSQRSPTFCFSLASYHHIFHLVIKTEDTHLLLILWNLQD
jgi:hypothetical protein